MTMIVNYDDWKEEGVVKKKSRVINFRIIKNYN